MSFNMTVIRYIRVKCVAYSRTRRYIFKYISAINLKKISIIMLTREMSIIDHSIALYIFIPRLS